MDYTIQFREDQKIVEAIAKGEWDSTTDDNMIRQILELVDSSDSQKVLLDIRELRFNFPVVQIFERAKEMREQRQQFGRVSTKSAIVYSSNNPKIEQDMQFFETTARNRGLPYRTFNDIEDAITWLTSDQ